MIVALVQTGVPRTTAARQAGVGESTFFAWLRQPAGPGSLLREAIEQAEAQVESQLLSVVTAAAVTDGRLALKLLERRFPERWARPRDCTPREDLLLD